MATLSARTQIIPVNDFSDADCSHRPKPGWKQLDPPHLWLEKLAHAWLTAQGKTINPNLRYYLDRLPNGYAVFERARPANPSIVDKHLYGHPKHKFFDSPNRFAPHFLHLMLHGSNRACPCTVCNGPTSSRTLPVTSLPREPVTSLPDNPDFDLAPRQPPTAVDEVLSLTSNSVIAEPKTGIEGRSSDQSRQSDNDQPQMHVHKRLPAAVLRTTDEEDIPDMVRWLIDRLAQAKSQLDEPIVEPLSMDWRAEHAMLDRDIAAVAKQHAWMPRKAEIVLFVRTLDGEICFDNASKTYKVFDETLGRFTGSPKWEAGVVGQTPIEPLGLQDILMETHKSRMNPVDSGFRIEPIPDPNDFAAKEWTKRYKYVPLHHIRPMAFWKDFMAGIPQDQQHPTISHALKCMSSFALVSRHRFKGSWPSATVFHKAIQIGAELIAVGDAVRLIPEASMQSSASHRKSAKDVLVLHVSSIRLQFSNLDKASGDDYDAGQPYNSSVLVAGRAYTLSPARAYDPQAPPTDTAQLPPGMQGYDTWRLAHAPEKLYAVPFARVAGRCVEAEAMLLWHPGRSSAPSAPPLDIGQSDILAARSWASLNDNRIARNKGKSWFWADARAELLGIMTLNGIAVDAWAGLRGQDVLEEQRFAINVLEKGAGKAERQRLQQELPHRDDADALAKMRGAAGGRMAVKAATATAVAAAATVGKRQGVKQESEDEGYVVERLLDKQMLDDGTEVYEVQWQGWKQTTWEPASVIAVDAPAVVRAYEKAQKQKPEQQRSRSAVSTTGRSASKAKAKPAPRTATVDKPPSRAKSDEEVEEAYVVDALKSKRKQPGTGITEYEVKWRGWDETTWEPATQLVEDAPQLVRRFEARLAAQEHKTSKREGTASPIKKLARRAAGPPRGRPSAEVSVVQSEDTHVHNDADDDNAADEDDSHESAGSETKHQSMLAAFKRGAAVRAAKSNSGARAQPLINAHGKRKRMTGDEGSSEQSNQGVPQDWRRRDSGPTWIDGAGSKDELAEEEEDEDEDEDEDDSEDIDAEVQASNAIKDWVMKIDSTGKQDGPM